MSAAINRLIALFSQAETEITKSLMGALSSGAEGTAAIKGQRSAEIKTILAHLLELAVAGRPEDPAGPAWDVVRSAYRTGAMRAAEGVGLAETQKFGGIHLDTARVLFENLVDALRNAVEYVGRKVDDEFRKATLEQTLQGAIQGATRRTQTQAIVEDLSDRGIKAFRDKAGREWSLTNYAAMAARTTAREAHTRGTVTRLAENGLDLVKISEHTQDELDVCTRHEGKIYSISGTSDTYPSILGNLPPYHPNCKHVATPFVERFA